MVIFIPSFCKDSWNILAYWFKISHRSPSGNYLVLSSQDGYCTLLEFEKQELGCPIPISGLCIPTFHMSKIPTQQLNILYVVDTKQVKCDENESPAMEVVVDDSNSASIDSRKDTEEKAVKEKDENNHEKDSSPSAALSQTKVAKRRITPMAID